MCMCNTHMTEGGGEEKCVGVCVCVCVFKMNQSRRQFLTTAVVDLLLAPLPTHQLRYWVAAERGRVLDVARKVIARFQHERKQEEIAEVRNAFQLLLRNCTDRRPTLLGDSKASAKTRAKAPAKHHKYSRRRTSHRDRATTYLHRARSLRSFYVPVPRWALAILVVQALACCMFIWSQIWSAGRCDKSEMVGGAPCIVPTFVRHRREFVFIIFVRVVEIS